MKKFFSLLGAFLIAVSMINSISAKNFSDLSNEHWAYSQIQALAKDEVVIGYPEGTFMPDKPVTRAEFATMVVKALRQENCILREIYYFSDMPEYHWAYDMTQKAQSFDLLKGYPDGTFHPDENIAKVDAVSMMIASVETSNITHAVAKKALKVYKDADSIPECALINTGKAEKLLVTAHNPLSTNLFEPDKKITRAEVAVSLFNMRKQALKRPNSKLAEAMKPIVSQGTVIDPVMMDGTIATIPAGTLIPVVLLNDINSQKSAKSEVFVTQAADNLVTKENYLLIAKGSFISGLISNIKPAVYFYRNGKAVLEAQNINTVRKQKADFPGDVSWNTKNYKLYQKIINFVVRGRKIKLTEGDHVFVKLAKPVRVDVTNSTILK